MAFMLSGTLEGQAAEPLTARTLRGASIAFRLVTEMEVMGDAVSADATSGAAVSAQQGSGDRARSQYFQKLTSIGRLH